MVRPKGIFGGKRTAEVDDGDWQEGANQQWQDAGARMTNMQSTCQIYYYYCGTGQTTFNKTITLSIRRRLVRVC